VSIREDSYEKANKETNIWHAVLLEISFL